MARQDAYKCDTCGYALSELQHQHEMINIGFGGPHDKKMPTPDLPAEPPISDTPKEDLPDTGFQYGLELGDCPACGGDHWTSLDVALTPVAETPPSEPKQGDEEEPSPVDSASADIVPPSPELNFDPTVDSYSPQSPKKKETP